MACRLEGLRLCIRARRPRFNGLRRIPPPSAPSRPLPSHPPRTQKTSACSKNALLYAAYVFIVAAAVAVALGVALNCPSLASGSLFVLLVMLVLAWAAVWASTTGLKVGSDG